MLPSAQKGDARVEYRGHPGALTQDLAELGPTAEAVKETLRRNGYEGPDATANLGAYLAGRGWHKVGLEPIGDSGWLCAVGFTAAGEKVSTDLPEPVLAYVNVKEGFCDPGLAASYNLSVPPSKDS
jgi:hypothetical protein